MWTLSPNSTDLDLWQFKVVRGQRSQIQWKSVWLYCMLSPLTLLLYLSLLFSYFMLKLLFIKSNGSLARINISNRVTGLYVGVRRFVVCKVIAWLVQGVEPSIRTEVWKFLLGFYNWTSTYKLRTELRKKKVSVSVFLCLHLSLTVILSVTVSVILSVTLCHSQCHFLCHFQCHSQCHRQCHFVSLSVSLCVTLRCLCVIDCLSKSVVAIRMC